MNLDKLKATLPDLTRVVDEATRILKESNDMAEVPLMKCGCTAQGVLTMSHGFVLDPPIHVCGVHDCTEVAETPNLAGREAHCGYSCGSKRPSNVNLAFFQYTPERDHDSYYCGCRGWD